MTKVSPGVGACSGQASHARLAGAWREYGGAPQTDVLGGMQTVCFACVCASRCVCVCLVCLVCD